MLCEEVKTPNLLISCSGVATNGKAETYSDQEKVDTYYLMCGGVID